MNSVGIDVSKGKSMIAVMRPFGELVVPPFEIHHTDSELCELAKLLRSLPGETRVVMEATGNYHFPVAWLLNDSGFYVSVVNAMLVHDYRNNIPIHGQKAFRRKSLQGLHDGLGEQIPPHLLYHSEGVFGFLRRGITLFQHLWIATF